MKGARCAMNSMVFLGVGAPGPFEILIILFVILLLFGAKRLPDLARSLGRSLSEFKKGREETPPREPRAEIPKKPDSTGPDHPAG